MYSVLTNTVFSLTVNTNTMQTQIFTFYTWTCAYTRTHDHPPHTHANLKYTYTRVCSAHTRFFQCGRNWKVGKHPLIFQFTSHQNFNLSSAVFPLCSSSHSTHAPDDFRWHFLVEVDCIPTYAVLLHKPRFFWGVQCIWSLPSPTSFLLQSKQFFFVMSSVYLAEDFQTLHWLEMFFLIKVVWILKFQIQEAYKLY